MKFNKDDNHLGIFDSQEEFVKHHIFKEDNQSIRYTKYLDCQKFAEEWGIIKYKFNTLEDGKISVSQL